ncbi:uncharacterized protein DNG_07465 [Cephalotrichum gorgonifer]|uniref:Uncharacterized protein n=1 Tax=Cephalotrichum gorgonifer TaxID=2041049 RepID=A0AAE8N4M5_9PEZI|nr:uncharacterized protein DNG_07465 [Cephalotrichum gorgonifer]
MSAKMRLVGLKLAWVSMGSTTLWAHGHLGGDLGEGDSSGGPAPQREGDLDWPTLVIEAGVSETLSELRGDMRWWFGASDHQVKIVLLAKLIQTERTVILEKWSEVQEPRAGAITGIAAQVQPRLQQTITITSPTALAGPASYVVHRGDLDWSLICCSCGRRSPPGPGEGDIALNIRTLQAYGEKARISGREGG